MKLQGIRVLDLSCFLPGPYLTLAMADQGAEVIKIEQPNGGDPGRSIGLVQNGHTVFFRNLNRGKRSLCIDLKTEEGKAELMALCAEADVFVESFRPGVMKRLGFDADTLRNRFPRLVYCSISAYGQNSPYADRPAHDLGVEAISGVLSLSLGADGNPAIPPIPVADVMSGLHGLAGVLMALLRREKTGKGDFIDISMLDSMVGASLNILGPTFAEGRQPVPSHERTTGGSAFYRIYRTSDGGHIALAGQEPKFVHALLGYLNATQYADLVLSGPGPHQEPVIRFLTDTFLQKTRDEWTAILNTLDVCFGPVRTLPEALQDEHFARRAMVGTDAQGCSWIGSPIHFSDEPAVLNPTPPELDEFRQT